MTTNHYLILHMLIQKFFTIDLNLIRLNSFFPSNRLWFSPSALTNARLNNPVTYRWPLILTLTLALQYQPNRWQTLHSHQKWRNLDHPNRGWPIRGSSTHLVTSSVPRRVNLHRVTYRPFSIQSNPFLTSNSQWLITLSKINHKHNQEYSSCLTEYHYELVKRRCSLTTSSLLTYRYYLKINEPERQSEQMMSHLL